MGGVILGSTPPLSVHAGRAPAPYAWLCPACGLATLRHRGGRHCGVRLLPIPAVAKAAIAEARDAIGDPLPVVLPLAEAEVSPAAWLVVLRLARRRLLPPTAEALADAIRQGKIDLEHGHPLAALDELAAAGGLP